MHITGRNWAFSSAVEKLSRHCPETEYQHKWGHSSNILCRIQKKSHCQYCIKICWDITLQEIQTTYSVVDGSNDSPRQWTTGMVIKLLETTHGQWLYQCIQAHDRVQGTQATLWKEELQNEIEAQQEMGYNGLLEEDQYLVLDDLEYSSGEWQECWLVTIRATWEAGLLWGVSQPNEGCNSSAQDGRFIT